MKSLERFNVLVLMINNQTSNLKQFQMTEIQNTNKPKVYDLEERTYKFAERTRNLTKRLSYKRIDIFEYVKQLIRSSGSIAANYIEANEALGKKDFIHRIKICRKEAKESRLWLRLIEADDLLFKERNDLIQESIELTKIFTAILQKSR